MSLGEIKKFIKRFEVSKEAGNQYLSGYKFAKFCDFFPTKSVSCDELKRES